VNYSLVAMSSASGHVVIVGGGVAGLEALIALRNLAGARVAATLVSREDSFVDRPRAVTEPFGLGVAARYSLAEIAAELDTQFVHATVEAVAAAEHEVSCAGGVRLAFDTLILAPGARMRAPLRDAIGFGLAGSGEVLKELIGRLRRGESRRVAFVAPSEVGWLLPLYELALMTAHALSRGAVQEVQLCLVTPEPRPLRLFGDRASESVARLLAAGAIEFVGETRATVRGGELVLGATGRTIALDSVVTLPLLCGPGLTGVPAASAAGFIEVDEHGRVRGLVDVYAAGDAVDFAVKQGGIAAQQADAVAVHVAARYGADVAPAPFAPVLRGMLLTGGEPRYLRADVPDADAEIAGAQYPLWWPPTKIAGRYLSPYLWGRSDVPPFGRPADAFIDVDIPLTASTWPA